MRWARVLWWFLPRSRKARRARIALRWFYALAALSAALGASRAPAADLPYSAGERWGPSCEVDPAGEIAETAGIVGPIVNEVARVQMPAIAEALGSARIASGIGRDGASGIRRSVKELPPVHPANLVPLTVADFVFVRLGDPASEDALTALGGDPARPVRVVVADAIRGDLVVWADARPAGVVAVVPAVPALSGLFGVTEVPSWVRIRPAPAGGGRYEARVLAGDVAVAALRGEVPDGR